MCVDWLNAGAQLHELERLGVDSLHWDVIDGRFAPDFAMGTSIINTFRAATCLPSNYHLMVEEPARILDTFEVSQGDVFAIHQECSRNLHRDLMHIRKMGCKPAVVLCPATPLETLDYVIEDIDVVILMTVNPGFKGQPLVPQTLRKVADLKRLITKRGLATKIEVDGSVSPRYIAPMVAAGADILVGGSTGLFRRDLSLEQSVNIMRREIERGLNPAEVSCSNSV